MRVEIAAKQANKEPMSDVTITKLAATGHF